jgi:protein TonB
MTRLRVTGRGVAYAASALIHGGVVWALLPSLIGSAAPTPAETPMAIEMAGFGTPAEPVDAVEPVETETAQVQPAEPTEVPPTETLPPDQPPETVAEEPPPPADTPVTETAEVEPPPPLSEEPPPELVTTTGETEAVVAAVPDTVQAGEPEIVQPPPTKPKPPVERRPPRRQPRPVQQPAEAAPEPTQQAALPPQPAAPPPPAAAAPASAGRPSKSYADRLGAYLSGRIRSVNSMVREETPVRVLATIELDGTLSSVELTQSSGSTTIDRELLRRIRAASPVPAPETRLQNIVLPFNLIPK